MIDVGFPLNVVNSRGDTLLIFAAYLQQPDTVAELLRRGADASAVNAVGQTAISCAVSYDNDAILRLLIEADADARLGAHSGLAIADQFGLPRMHKVIEEFPHD